MMKNIDVDSFLDITQNSVIVDVRTPAEYLLGHIPNSINLPIFSNEQRAEVGTIYKKVSKEKAIERGLDFVGVKLGDFVRTLRKHLRKMGIDGAATVGLYCWRGGMRSNSMAWLFSTAGFNVVVLKGGYKAYRSSFIDKLNCSYWKYMVLGGPTGCGKTYILHALREKGQQVIDLEGLAAHRGSAFGRYGHTLEQPSSEHFANMIYHQLREMDPQIPVWLEAESMSIGRVFMPQELYCAIQAAEIIHFELDRESRLDHIMSDYGDCSVQMLKECFENISKRLGYDNAKRAIELVESGDIRSAASIALDYYDKGYAHSLGKRSNSIKHRIVLNEYNVDKAVEILIKKQREIYE